MNQILALSHAGKAFDDKVVLDDVTLAFLPGAKIGVVGPNGTGKSTLLRMMAGVEQPSNGGVRLMPGYTVGILEQEPQLDESKTVLGNVEDGVAETKALLDRYNQIAEQMTVGYSEQDRPSRRRGSPPAPRHLPQARPLSASASRWTRRPSP
jgi:ATPase subunit of ABC transporter with duplicated ATPase domains